VPGEWADVDIAGPAHNPDKLPATEEEAFTRIDAVGLPIGDLFAADSAYRSTGSTKRGGGSNRMLDRAAAKSLSTRFQNRLRQIGQIRGWVLDPTADLCRVQRVPGIWKRTAARPMSGG
jgi:hypothetical protein